MLDPRLMAAVGGTGGQGMDPRQELIRRIMAARGMPGAAGAADLASSPAGMGPGVGAGASADYGPFGVPGLGGRIGPPRSPLIPAGMNALEWNPSGNQGPRGLIPPGMPTTKRNPRQRGFPMGRLKQPMKNTVGSVLGGVKPKTPKISGSMGG